MVKWPPGDGDDAIVSLFRAFFDQVAAAAVSTTNRMAFIEC